LHNEPDLSHWSLGTCDYNDIKDYVLGGWRMLDVGSPPDLSGTWLAVTVEEGSASEIPGHPSVKFDAGAPKNQYTAFKLVLQGTWAKESVPWHTKEGSECEHEGSVLGPSCDPYPCCKVRATLAGGGDCYCKAHPATLVVNTEGTTCSATLHYEWYLDGSSIPGPDAPSYSTSTEGTYTVLVQCKDGSTVLCEDSTNEVNVNLDTEAPCFDECPDDVTLGCNAKLPPPPTLTASDDCDDDVHVELTSETCDSDECYVVCHRTWTATDDCGNTETCTQDITIPLDTEKPTFDNCPEDTTLECNADLPAAPTVTASDNCDADVKVELTSETSDEYKCETVWHRTWTATDDCGNTQTCTQDITIPIDTEKPTFDNCPEDATLECNATLPPAPGPTGMTVLGRLGFSRWDVGVPVPTVTASDNCDTDVKVELTSETSDEYACETVWHRTWTATDDCGNTETCTQDITIPIDTEKPTFGDGLGQLRRRREGRTDLGDEG